MNDPLTEIRNLGDFYKVIKIFLFIYRLFENNEEIFSYFKWVKNTSSVAAVRQNKSLVAHAEMVMRVLDDAISSFSDADSITDLLLTIGASHHQIPNFNGNLFLVRIFFL